MNASFFRWKHPHDQRRSCFTSSSRDHRWPCVEYGVAAFTVLLTLALFPLEHTVAQGPGNRSMGKNGWRWHSSGSGGIYSGNRSVRTYGGLGYTTPLYRYGNGYGFGYGYGGYGGGGQTAYGQAVEAQADLTRAQGQASKNNAQAAVANEQAREQYLKNQERYNGMRREQKAVIDARKEQESEERAERRERKESAPAKRPTDLYPRLPIDQIDGTTGQIHWPKSLQAKQFDAAREKIDAQLKFIAENGPNERSAGIVKNVADDMKKASSSIMSDMGFEAYSEARKFLCSLSVEGYFALEEL